MSEYIIRALFKVELSPGNFIHYPNLEYFLEDGGEVGVYKTAKWGEKLKYDIHISPREETDRDGYHLVQAVGIRSDPPAFCPWLLMKIKNGALSYHLLTKPDASDGQVYCS